MKSVKFLLLIAVIAVSGCQRKVTIETDNKTGQVTVIMPAEGVGAAELLQARGLADAAYTITAKREEQVFLLRQAELRKSERQFYAILIVVGVVGGIVSVFSVGMFILVKKFGGVPK